MCQLIARRLGTQPPALLESWAQRFKFSVVGCGFEPEEFCDEVVDVYVLKAWEFCSWADVRAIRDEEGFHLGHAGCVVAVVACGRLAGAFMGAKDVGSVGHNDRIAFAWVFVEVQIGGDVGSAVNSETWVGVSAKALVGLLRIGFGVRVEERAIGFEVREIGVLVEGDPVAFDLRHAVIGEDDEVDGEVRGVELGLQVAHELIDVMDLLLLFE